MSEVEVDCRCNVINYLKIIKMRAYKSFIHLVQGFEG